MSGLNVNVNLTLDDMITFGKYKGKSVGKVYEEDVGYLVWLRQERKNQNADERFFAPELHILLDDAIKNSKSLRAKYKPWNVNPAALAAIQETAEPTEPPPQRMAPEMAYSAAWGAF